MLSEISYSSSFLGLHSDRLVYWTNQYEEEKQILLNQYASEMERYKDRKFRAQKELECVYYAMESANEAQIKQNEQEQMAKTDEIKSQVSNLCSSAKNVKNQTFSF